MTLLRPGQAVRCARCAGEWVPSPAAPVVPEEAPVEAPAGRAEPMPAARPTPTFGRAAARTVQRSAAQQARPRRNVAVRLAWGVSVLVVLLLGWGAYVEQARIMQVWPPSIRLYAALGLAAGH